MWQNRAALVFVWCAVFLATSAGAAGTLSSYERHTLLIGLQKSERELDDAPEGKVVEGIDVVTLDVIEPRDPAPRFLNWFHATTRKNVIEREVLTRPGERFTRKRADETERNLRDKRQLSVVLVVGVKGAAPDRVRILVVTKDVWSLRVNNEPTFVNGRLQSIVLQPSEENFLGQHKTLNGNVSVGRATYQLGLGFIDPRIGGSRLQAAASANLVFNCRTGDVEGSNGVFSYGKPLYSTTTRWSWVAAVSFADGISRPLGVLGKSVCSDDRPVSIALGTKDNPVSVPFTYHSSSLSNELAVTRSFGVDHKTNLTFGLEASRRSYSALGIDALPSDIQAQFESRTPVSDQRLSPFAQAHVYETRYLRGLDLETLGLQEDFRLGYDVWLRVYPAAKAVGSSRNLLGVFSGLGYTVPLGDGLARAYASSTIELSTLAKTDGELLAGARFVTPRLGFGRFVADAFVLDRYQNYLNPLTSIGGTGRLRGYVAQAFAGPNAVAANLEYRTPHVDILSVQVGAAAFYDMGDAFTNFDSLRLRHGAGAGLRFLIPQIDKIVFRVDVATPLNRNDPAGETTVIAQFGQAFPTPGLVTPGLVQ